MSSGLSEKCHAMQGTDTNDMHCKHRQINKRVFSVTISFVKFLREDFTVLYKNNYLPYFKNNVVID